MDVGHRIHHANQSDPLRNPSLNGRKRSRQRLRLGATGHRHVGLAAALAADLLGDKVGQFAGFDAAHHVGCSACG